MKFDIPLKLKEIVDSTNMEQQQYFRVAKKIKKEFVSKLKDEGHVVAEETVHLHDSNLIPAGKKIKLLFYQMDDDSLHLLIGLARIQGDNSSDSHDDYDSEASLNQHNRTLISQTNSRAGD